MAKLRNVSNNWAQIVSCMVNIPAKNSIWSVIQRLMLGASVYYIWQERNMRLFGSYGRTEEELLKIIVDAVRCRIMGLKLSATTDVMNAAEIWGFPIDKKLRYRYILDDLMTDYMDIDGLWWMGTTGGGNSWLAEYYAIGMLSGWRTGWWCNEPVSTGWAYSNCFNDFSYCAGCLLVVECYGPDEVIDDGLWHVCCSCDSKGSERSNSFSFFMVLPMWFYMIRFFKEKTFINVAAVSGYSVNVNTVIMDEAYGLDNSWICFLV
ncbi:Phytosulfokine [Artemisia annua]|uniref:Phytosulfokine n=1 Tax=Artemisia annua TaxID=35608 RepID=A0A2U1NMK9_ARTAN|nr:Phytosulfokine [Artemisia annua]